MLVTPPWLPSLSLCSVGQPPTPHLPDHTRLSILSLNCLTQLTFPATVTSVAMCVHAVLLEPPGLVVVQDFGNFALLSPPEPTCDLARVYHDVARCLKPLGALDQLCLSLPTCFHDRNWTAGTTSPTALSESEVCGIDRRPALPPTTWLDKLLIKRPPNRILGHADTLGDIKNILAHRSPVWHPRRRPNGASLPASKQSQAPSACEWLCRRCS